jgi:hypothetical protein
LHPVSYANGGLIRRARKYSLEVARESRKAEVKVKMEYKENDMDRKTLDRTYVHDRQSIIGGNILCTLLPSDRSIIIIRTVESSQEFLHRRYALDA